MRRTGLWGLVSILSGLLCAACSGAPDVDPSHAPSHSRPALLARSTGAMEQHDRVSTIAPVPVATVPGSPRKVFLVSSRETFRGLSGLARPRRAHRDATGTDLVVSEVDAARLEEAAGLVHRIEQRCGGFFAFDTREKAEAFLRSDRSTAAIAATQASYALDNQPTVVHWLPQVRESRIRDTIAHLSSYQNRYFASATGRESAEWIRDTWASMAAGRSDVTTELFTACAACSTQPSVVLTIAGTTLPDEVVVLGAHLDSINGNGGGSPVQSAPGADDDASGIAVLTETLRIALASGWRPKRTVKFMGYAAEEVGLRGSNAIAQAYRGAGVDVVAVLQVDMTNYRAGAVQDMKLVTDYSSTSLKAFFVQLFDAYLAPLGHTRGTYTCGYGCSDHASWTNAGYPAAMMFEAGDPGGSFPYIHTTSDTLAMMGDTAQPSVKFAQFALAFLGETAKTRAMHTGGPLPPMARR
ncbi:M28 family metallopeptidase [Luteimonas notoginsengisoli]